MDMTMARVVNRDKSTRDKRNTILFRVFLLLEYWWAGGINKQMRDDVILRRYWWQTFIIVTSQIVLVVVQYARWLGSVKVIGSVLRVRKSFLTNCCSTISFDICATYAKRNWISESRPFQENYHYLITMWICVMNYHAQALPRPGYLRNVRRCLQ